MAKADSLTYEISSFLKRRATFRCTSNFATDALSFARPASHPPGDHPLVSFFTRTYVKIIGEQ